MTAVRSSLLTLLALTLTTTPARPATPLPVGVARVDITPEYPVRLSGFGFRRAESEGITQHIWAKALAIGSDEQGPAVLITVDNLGVPDGLVTELARRLAKKAGVRPERLAVTATHTHTAPMLRGVAPTLFGQPIPAEHQKHIDRYTDEFLDHLEKAALAALADRKPAHLFWAVGKVTFARNRRTRGGPVDHDLPVLFVKDPKGKVRAVLATYACHCVTLSNNKISGDWAGYAQDTIERLLPGCTALVSIGCGADSNPDSGVTGDKVEVARAQGAQVADEVKRLLAGKLTPITTVPTAKVKRIALPFDKLPTRAQWEERVKRGGAVGYHAKVQLARLDRGEKLQARVSYPIKTWAFGDELAMVFLPGEVVVDYALRLKKELDSGRVWIQAYANAAPCYIPSERVLKEGGYEGGGAMIYYDRPTRFAPGLEDKIVGEVHRQLGATFEPKKERESGLSPEESRSRIRLPDGLKAELVAAEPLVVDPVAIDFGLDGRLWVAEMHDYPLGLDGKFKPGGRVKVLTDTDGDGKYDRADTFLDGLPFPTDVKVWRKGVLVCAAPDVLYAEDTDGDGKADKRRVLFTGYATHNYQARVNSLRWGLDGWLYGAAGIFGGTIKSFSGKELALGQRDFRCNPDTGAIEPASGRTQQGRARDDWGDWFGCDNSTLARHYPLTDHYLARNPHLVPPAPGVLVPDYLDSNRLFPASDSLQLFKLSGPPGRVTAACGLGIYRDELLGKAYRGNAFTCEPVNLVVHRLVLSPRGVTFSGRRAPGEERREFLASTDGWFRPVQVRTGPDGALWVVDMYRHVIEHPRWIPPETLAKLDVRAGDTQGRIYRIVPEGGKPREVPRLDRLDTPGLVAVLESPNGTLRDLAHQMLLWKHDRKAIAPLEKLASEGKRPTARLHALCALDALGGLEPERVAKALGDPHPGVRRHAVRLAEKHLGKSDAVEGALLRLVRDPDPHVRLQLAYTLGEWRDPRAAKALADLLLKDHGDVYLRAAALSSLRGDNVGAVFDVVLAREGEGTAARAVLGQAGALGDRKVLGQVVRTIAGSGKGQLQALDEFLDGIERRGASPASLLDDSAKKEMAKVFDKTRTLAVSEKGTQTERLAAVALLGREPGHVGEDVRLLAGLLTAKNPDAIQAGAVAALGRLPGKESAKELLARWPALSPARRSQALDLLLMRKEGVAALLSAVESGRVLPGQLDAARRQLLLRHRNAAVRKRAAKALGAVNADRARVVREYGEALTLKGDPARGRAAFQKRCANCHRLEGVGNTLGPDLAALTDRRPETLLVALLDPNRDVEGRYLSYVAETKKGRVFTGIVAAESGGSITLRDAEGKEHVLPRAGLERLENAGVSLMPEGLEKELTRQDVADVLAYIAEAERPKRFPGNDPQVISADAHSRLSLPARHAALYGGDIRFETPFGNIGYWHGERDRAVWQVRLAKKGKYDVYLDYACHPDSAGNDYVLEAQPPLRGVVADTGGWDRYRWQKLGTITLEAGTTALTLRPDGKLTRRALFDVRGLLLVPEGQPRTETEKPSPGG